MRLNTLSTLFLSLILVSQVACDNRRTLQRPSTPICPENYNPFSTKLTDGEKTAFEKTTLEKGNPAAGEEDGAEAGIYVLNRVEMHIAKKDSRGKEQHLHQSNFVTASGELESNTECARNQKKADYEALNVAIETVSTMELLAKDGASIENKGTIDLQFDFSGEVGDRSLNFKIIDTTSSGTLEKPTVVHSKAAESAFFKKLNPDKAPTGFYDLRAKYVDSDQTINVMVRYRLCKFAELGNEEEEKAFELCAKPSKPTKP